MPDFVADSYAFVAALDGSKAYAKLLGENEVVTTTIHLVEVGAAVLRRAGASQLEAALAPLYGLCVEPPARVAVAAARFRVARREAGASCSHVDALGYALAQHLGVPFLTGDEAFRGVPGVKFVKA
jgi:PIN domain nuclease of toxin-antitoxin system